MVANVIFEISNFRLVAPSDLSDLSDLSDSSDKKLVDLLTRRLVDFPRLRISAKKVNGFLLCGLKPFYCHENLLFL